MVISHNLAAMNANRQFNIVTGKRKKSMEKLGSGYRINRAADDAAGLAISEKMRRQIRGLTQGTQNTQDGVSMCQIADGALNEVSDMLHRITELSVKAANETYTNEDRQAIQKEVNQLLTEIDRVSDTTTFNEQRIFSKDISPEGTSSVLSPFETAKKELQDATYHMMSSDVVLSDGKTIAKDDANAMIRILSNVAILGKGYEIYEENIDNYPPGLKYAMSEVKEYIVDNRDKIQNNTHPLYSYGGSEGFTQVMERTEEYLENAVNRYKTNGEFNYSIENTVFDGYVQALHIQPRTDMGYCIGEGLFYTDSLMYNSNRTMGLKYEVQIANAGGRFMMGVKSLLENNGITSGSLYGYANGSLREGSDGTRIREGVSAVDIATNIYMGLLGIENDAQSSNLESHNEFWIQSGADVGDGLFITFGRMDTNKLGIRGLDVSSASGASDSIERTKLAVNKLNEIRSNIGAQQNRLEHIIKHQENTVENTQAAESRIRDTDMSKEIVQNSMQDILSQAGIAMMSQANQSNQGVLSLLQ